MTLKEFINHYDKEGYVVLLEGKRKVPEADREKLIALGRRLAAEAKNMIFRNGNAEGADELAVAKVHGLGSKPIFQKKCLKS